MTGSSAQKVIALIDTGVNASDLVDAVSLTDDDVKDPNGHGTRMYDMIRDEYPEARILSIKAMHENGKGQASDIYAAVQYAMLYGADIINLSVSAFSTVDNTIVRNVIEDAISKGITVVGAAGNNGANVKYYIPGSISQAVIVGACDENGIRLENSNYGATVDYNVVADSTSEAAARMSGIIARNDGCSYVYAATYDEEENEVDRYIYENGEFVIDNDPSKGHSGTMDYVKRVARSGNTVVLRHYDKNGNPYTDVPQIMAYGYVTNTLCARFDGSPGDNGYEFDVSRKEITQTNTKQLIYNVANAIKNGTLRRTQTALLCIWKADGNDLR